MATTLIGAARDAEITALQVVKGIGPATAQSLVEHYGSALDAVQAAIDARGKTLPEFKDGRVQRELARSGAVVQAALARALDDAPGEDARTVLSELDIPMWSARTMQEKWPLTDRFAEQKALGEREGGLAARGRRDRERERLQYEAEIPSSMPAAPSSLARTRIGQLSPDLEALPESEFERRYGDMPSSARRAVSPAARSVAPDHVERAIAERGGPPPAERLTSEMDEPAPMSQRNPVLPRIPSRPPAPTRPASLVIGAPRPPPVPVAPSPVTMVAAGARPARVSRPPPAPPPPDVTIEGGALDPRQRHIVTPEGNVVSVRGGRGGPPSFLPSWPTSPPSARPPRASRPPPPAPPPAPTDAKGTIQDCTQKAVIEALERNPGNKSAAARELGLTREGLYGVLRRMGWQSDPVARNVRSASGAAGANARWGGET